MASRPFAIVVGALALICVAVSLALVGDVPASEAAWAARAGFVCPVTIPNGQKYPFEPVGGNHGSQGIITEIPTDGHLRFSQNSDGSAQADGALAMTFRWWRQGRGLVRVDGRRLDAPAPAVRTVIPPGYGDTGLQPMSLVFPTSGCWRITSQVGASTLTMTLLVEKFGTGPWTSIDRDRTPSPECARQLAEMADGRWPPPASPRPEVRGLIDSMRSMPFADASRAGNALTRQPEFSDGKSVRDIVALLGPPDTRYPGTLFYKTNGGPLEFSFNDCRLIHTALITPARWRGTDEELAARWAKARHTRQWTQWEPMTGWLWPAHRPAREGVEVDLNGGFYGRQGPLSFSLPTGARCTGNWIAAPGSEPAVTPGDMLRTLGPRHLSHYKMPDRLEPWQILGRANATCGNGRFLRFEFVTGHGEAHGWGIAIDDRRVVYLFTF